MASQFFIVFFTFSFLIRSGVCQRKREVVYVISGSDAFGGHIGQWFNQPIRDVIALTSQNLDDDFTNFGVLWTIPKESKSTYWIISSMQNRTTRLKYQVNKWLNSSSAKTKPNKRTGLGESIKFAKKHLFSNDSNSDKVIIALTHMNIMTKEIDLFLTDNCSDVLVNVIIFPWPWLDCNGEKMRKVLRYFNQKLTWTGYYTHDLAICGRQFRQIQQLSQTIRTELPNMKKVIIDFCTPTTPVPVTLPPIILQPNSTTPTPIIRTEIVIVKETDPPCQKIWCQKWLVQFYFLENLVIIFIILLIFLLICCRLCCFRKPKPSKAKDGFRIKDGLLIHYKSYAPPTCRVGYGMPVARTKKLKRRSSRNSLVSRSSTAVKVKETPEKSIKRAEVILQMEEEEPLLGKERRRSKKEARMARKMAAEGLSLGELGERQEREEIRSIQSAPAERDQSEPLVSLFRRPASHQVVTGPSVGPDDEDFLLELAIQGDGKINEEYMNILIQEALSRRQVRKKQPAKTTNKYGNPFYNAPAARRTSDLQKIHEVTDFNDNVELLELIERMPRPEVGGPRSTRFVKDEYDNAYTTTSSGRSSVSSSNSSRTNGGTRRESEQSSRKQSGQSTTSRGQQQKMSSGKVEERKNGQTRTPTSRSQQQATANIDRKTQPETSQRTVGARGSIKSRNSSPDGSRRSFTSKGTMKSRTSPPEIPQRKSTITRVTPKGSQTSTSPPETPQRKFTQGSQASSYPPETPRRKTTPKNSLAQTSQSETPQRKIAQKSSQVNSTLTRPDSVDIRPAYQNRRQSRNIDTMSTSSRQSVAGSQRRQSSRTLRGMPSPTDSAYGSGPVSTRSAGKPPISPRTTQPATFQLQVTHYFDYEQQRPEPSSTASTPRRLQVSDQTWPRSAHSTPTHSIRRRSATPSLPDKFALVDDPDLRYERGLWIPPASTHC